jgi:hypothetical protein
MAFTLNQFLVVCVFSSELHFLTVEGRIILSEQCNIYVNFFMLFCTVHCNLTVQYKPTTCTFVKLMFLFLRCILHVSNTRVHLQEDGFTYRCGIICLHTKYTILYKQSCRWQFSLTKVHVVGLYFTICLCVTKFEVFKTINSCSDYVLP